MDVAAARAPRRLVLALGITIALLAAAAPFLPSYVVIVLTEGLIYAIAAASLDLLLGFTGLPSLGHAAFFAVGAYATGILVTRHRVSFAIALLASILLAAAATGITGIPRPRLLTGAASGTLAFYYTILVVFAGCLTLYLLVVWSPFGKTLIGIRDSESRMRVLGYNVFLHTYVAMIVAGAFAGVAGSLYAYFNGFVGPSTVDLAHSMQFVLMVIMGGPATIVGPVIGAFVVTFLEKLVSIVTDRWMMVLAAVYVVTALWAPRGILGVLRGAR